MPSSIPYTHPSLTLGAIADPGMLDKLKQIGVLQSKIDAAQDKVNAYLSMRRSLDMTVNELLAMNVDITTVAAKSEEMGQLIAQSAADYAATRLSAEEQIQALKTQIAETAPSGTGESPLDLELTGIRKMPLSADSLQLDAQYFSYDENQEDNPLAVQSSIEQYIRASVAPLGERAAAGVSGKASAQISLQRKNHDIAGTLVITASCTHRQAVNLSPFVLDVDKAVNLWNDMFRQQPILLSDPTGLHQSLVQESDDPGTGMSILSGATCGSSFVGMVHVLRQDATGPSMTTLATNLQERMKIGGWLEESAGGFGVDPAISSDIKNLLSTQRVTSHINLVIWGVVPSIRSNLVAMGVRTFADFDPSKLAATLNNATSAETQSVDQSATAAKTGARLLTMQGAAIQSVMTGLGKIDQSGNQVMDINTLMNAFEDYLEEVRKGDAGIPINFQVRTVTRQELIRQWLNKYYPSNETPKT
ncbi:hypothetical protein ACWKWU_07300 [Chitinophaga lutea]